MYHYSPFAISVVHRSMHLHHIDIQCMHIAHDSFKMLLADSVNGNSTRQQISLTLQWLKTRSDFSNTEPSSILHCNVLVSAFIIIMNYSSSTSCNTIRCNVVQTAAYIILSRLHCTAQIEAAYIIVLLSRRWASTHWLSFTDNLFTIGTEGALWRPLTYDKHPTTLIRPPKHPAQIGLISHWNWGNGKIGLQMEIQAHILMSRIWMYWKRYKWLFWTYFWSETPG